MRNDGFKVTLVTFYGNLEHFDDMARALQNENIVVHSYPLFQYVADPNDRIEDAVNHFHKELVRENPDAILWQCLVLNDVVMENIKRLHPKRLHLHYNPSDTHVWTDPSLHFEQKQAIFDRIFTTCHSALPRYGNRGRHLKPSVNANFFAPSPDAKLSCDVVMVVGNLRDGASDAKISRRKLIEDLARCAGLNFHLYGPPIHEKNFPTVYKGYAPYSRLARIYSNAKVSLSIGASSKDGGAISTKTLQILASGGLLVTDSSAEFDQNLVNGKHYLELPTSDPVNFILHVVKNHERYKGIRQDARKICLTNYPWSNLAIAVHEEIVKRTFDYKYYCEINSIAPPDYSAAWQHWVTVGKRRGALTFKPLVRPDFSWEEYVSVNQLDALKYDTELKAWTHYLEIGKKRGYILCINGDGRKRKLVAQTVGDGVPINVSKRTNVEFSTAEDVLKMYGSITSAIVDVAKIPTALKELSEFCGRCVRSDVNDILEDVYRLWVYNTDTCEK